MRVGVLRYTLGARYLSKNTVIISVITRRTENLASTNQKSESSNRVNTAEHLPRV
jgi:hypothetical protein